MGTVSKAEFDRAYDTHILGREFVEFREYYERSRERYWRSFKFFERFPLPENAETLDIGGGQFGILLGALRGCRATAADKVDRAGEDVNAAGMELVPLDLMADDYGMEGRFDAITMLEVIEHLPVPPYVTFGKLRKLLKPGGFLFLTTPNGYRIRNILYMLANKRILDHFRFAEPGRVLGHQLEYTLQQIEWQLSQAGFEVAMAELYENGWRGASLKARISHAATLPFTLAPHLRSAVVACGRNPDS